MFKHFNVLVSKYFHFEGFANCNERTCFSQTLLENKGHFKSHDVQDNCLPVFSEVCLLPSYYQFSSVTQSCLTLCNPRDYNMPGFPVHHQLPELSQTHVIESVMPSSHLILCRPLFLLPSIFPSIRVFSSESLLHMRWPKDWSFSFSISQSNEHSGLISFRMDWFDLLQSKGLSRVFSNTTVQKHQFFGAQLSL